MLFHTPAFSQYEAGYNETNSHVTFYSAMDATQGNKVFKNIKGHRTTVPSSYRLDFVCGYQSEGFILYEAGAYYDLGNAGLSGAIGLSTDTERKIHAQLLTGADFNSAFLKARIVYTYIGLSLAYHTDQQFYFGIVAKVPF